MKTATNLDNVNLSDTFEGKIADKKRVKSAEEDERTVTTAVSVCASAA